MPAFEVIPWQDKIIPPPPAYNNYIFLDESGTPTYKASNPAWDRLIDVPAGPDSTYVDIYPRFGSGLSDICNFDFKLKPRLGTFPEDFNGADKVTLYFRYTGGQWNADQFQSAIDCDLGTICGKYQDLPDNLDPNFIYFQKLENLDPPGTGKNTLAGWQSNLYIEMDLQPNADFPGHPYMRVYAFSAVVKYTSAYDFGQAWWLLGES